MPSVSVVVICYNDAARLEQAVRSATGQTLRDIEVVVVDDGSTDGSALVAARLAAADPRVRVVGLPVNSGGCSRPRNTGLESATGDYVTFLDSDDALPRRACERLLRTAAKTRAEVVCGRVVRRHHDPTRYVVSDDDLYKRALVVEGIAARPEQLRDSVAVGKLYARQLLVDAGVRFPEGLLHEDLLFTAEAYVAAHRLAVVPDVVYVYDVRSDSTAPSITQSRDARRWHDRFEVHRRIDAFLDERGVDSDLRAAKDRKFLDVDFLIFLRQLRQWPAAGRAELVAMAGDYVREIDVTHAGSKAGPRIGAVLAAAGDVDEVLLAADYAVNGGVGSDVIARAPDTGVLSASFADTPFLSTVRHVRWGDGRLYVDGVVTDVLDRLGPVEQLHARLVVSGRLGGRLWAGDALLTTHRAGVAFAATVDLARLGRRLGRPTVGHELRLTLELRRGGEVARRPLSARDAELPDGDQPLPTPWRAVVGDRARVIEANGRLVLRLSALPAMTRGALAGASWARHAARVAAGRLGRP